MPTNRIDNVHIEGIPPISEPMDLTLDPRVNLLIGPNGCGKSTVIRSIVSMLQNPHYWLRPPWPRMRGQSEVDLRHELGEIHDAQIQFEPESDSDIHHYHDGRFTEAETAYDDFIQGVWYGDGGLGSELLPNLRVPLVYVPATRLSFPKKDDIVPAYVLSEATISDDVFDSRRVFDAMGRFVRYSWDSDGLAMTEEEIWQYEIRTMDPNDTEDEWESYVLNVNGPEAETARKKAVLEAAAVCAARICNEILKPEILSEYSHSTEFGLRTERGVTEVTYPHWLTHTHDNSDDPITIGELSAGTQGPLMWLWHVVLELHDFFVKVYRHRLTHHKFRRIGQFTVYRSSGLPPREQLTPDEYNAAGRPPGYEERIVDGLTDEVLSWEQYRELGAPRDYRAEPIPLPEEEPDEWRRMPFILLIDEIENHLHPAWQRRVIPALLETFPNMQLIATTHSPFVVAGRNTGQVHRMFRDEEGTVRAETSEREIMGWTVEEILRTFMEIDDPTDEETSVAATVLRWLRDQKPDESESAEGWRQRKISELSEHTAPTSVNDLAGLGWLQRLASLSGNAQDWWRNQIDQLEEQVNPTIEFQWPERADRERYIAELENILWVLEERLGEDLLGG